MSDCLVCGETVDLETVEPVNPDKPRGAKKAGLRVVRDGEEVFYCADHAELRPAPEPKVTKPKAKRGPDPLKGKRHEIETNDKDSILWPYSSTAPVEKGQVFEVGRIAIEITSVTKVKQRVKDEKTGDVRPEWKWRAEFIRINRVSEDRVYLLGKNGGYTDDPRTAMRAPSQHDAETINGVDWREVVENQGPPPEPEGIPSEKIADLPSAQEAKAAHRRAREQRLIEYEELPLSVRLRRIELIGDKRLGRQVARIEDSIRAAERKLQERGKDPTDRAA